VLDLYLNIATSDHLLKREAGPSPSKPQSRNKGDWVALVSGLDVGSSPPNVKTESTGAEEMDGLGELRLELLTDLLIGESGCIKVACFLPESFLALRF
jgi:hypothetical protein